MQNENTDISRLMEESTKKMAETISALKSEFLTVRAGRASASVLDKIKVDYYGSRVHIKEMANISVPEPRVLLISPWDASSLNTIVKAIQSSDVGINPSSDGKVIRMVFPELTEERRKEIVKHVKRYGDEAKIAIRSVRRDMNEKLKKLEKDKLISEDEMKRAEDENQKQTDNCTKDIDKVVSEKEKEILEF